MSRTSFVLKGNGWYVSDYGYRKGITEDGGTGATAPAKAEPVTPVKQGEKSLAKTDSSPKPETKSGNDASAAPKSASADSAPAADSKSNSGTK